MFTIRVWRGDKTGWPEDGMTPEGKGFKILVIGCMCEGIT